MPSISPAHSSKRIDAMRIAFSCAAVLLALPVASVRIAVSAEVVQVKIADLAFAPADITIKEGDTIEWVNSDFIDHTATAKDGGWDVFIAVGQSARQQFKQAGTSQYYCRVHPDMIGTIHVVADR